MITVENHIGRLLEVRIKSEARLEDVEAMGAAAGRLLAQLKRSAVFCTDMREAVRLTPEVVARLTAIYRMNNARVERTAVLVEEHAAYRAAIERVLHEAGSSARRVFSSLPDAARWLDEKLDPLEQRRMRDFVAGLAAAPASGAPRRRPPRS